MRPSAGTMRDPGEKTEFGGLARSIDALFSRAPAPPSTDDPGPDTRAHARVRSPRYDGAARRRTLVVTGLVIAVIIGWVLAMEVSHHEQHLAEFNTAACRRNVAAAGILALALVVTCWAWIRARPKARPLLTLEEIRQTVPT